VIGLRKPALQLGVRLGIVEGAADIEDPSRERIEDGVVDGCVREWAPERLPDLLAVASSP
jgi:hypothetical protein